MYYKRVAGKPKADQFALKLTESGIPILFKSTVARKLHSGLYILDYYFVVADKYTTDLQFAYYLMHV